MPEEKKKRRIIKEIKTTPPPEPTRKVKPKEVKIGEGQLSDEEIAKKRPPHEKRRKR